MMSILRPLVRLRFLAALAGLAVVATSSAPALAAAPQADWLDIEVGKSVVIETPKNATAIAITNPDVADVVPLASANKIQVQGKSVGTTDLIIQLGAGVEPTRFEITVHYDLSDLVRRIDELVEGESPKVYPLRERIVVDGPVPDLDTLEQVAAVARIYDPEFVNLMTVKGDHQVQLEVTFAEVARSATRELGVNWMLHMDNQTTAGVSVYSEGPTGSASGMTSPENAVVTGDLLGAPTGTFGITTGVALGNVAVGAILGVLDGYDLSKYLAQPTLTCLSGQQCEFLAGGEMPVQTATATGTPAVSYKEYGVKLSFVPTVLAGNVIDMRVQLEVSEPDGTNAGAFITRKAKSHVRLDNGMTFAIGGMTLQRTQYTRQQYPLLGAIPILGSLFRYTRHDRTETEVMMFVTPRLVRPLAAGEVPAYPGTTENNNPTDLELFLLGMDHRTGSRSGQPASDIGLAR